MQTFIIHNQIRISLPYIYLDNMLFEVNINRIFNELKEVLQKVRANHIEFEINPLQFQVVE